MNIKDIKNAPKNRPVLGAVVTGEGMTGIDGPFDYKFEHGAWLIREDAARWRAADPQPTHWFV